MRTIPKKYLLNINLDNVDTCIRSSSGSYVSIISDFGAKILKTFSHIKAQDYITLKYSFVASC